MSDNILSFLTKSSQMVEKYLSSLSAESDFSKGLVESMRYTLLIGGKRLRPALLYASYSLFDDNLDNASRAAAAIEMVHTYSLIHDDLPAMDNDDLRRGKPTNHKVFGEAVAILAGDGLLTKAFELLSSDRYEIAPLYKVRLVNILATLAGDRGMVAGQYADVQNEGKAISKELLEYIHSRKTGALIKASLLMGQVSAMGALNEDISSTDSLALSKYADNIGLIFQIVDDILDVTSNSETLGKSVGKDENSQKVTYPALYGLEESYKIVEELYTEARDCLLAFGERAELLIEIARFLKERKS